MLFTINKPPLSSSNLEMAMRIAPKGAPILLFEDGVYAAQAAASSEALVKTALAQHPLYALGPDLEARGVRKLVQGVCVIGYDGFVQLVEQHQVVPWL